MQTTKVRNHLLFIILFSLCCLSFTTHASTRIGFGYGAAQAYKKSTSQANKQSELEFRLSLEHEFSNQWSIEATNQINTAFDLQGIYGKYRFSPKQASFYAKLGPIRYHRTYYSGNSFLGAVGWQYIGESNWGFAAEAYFSEAKNKDLVGITLSISYGFDWFN